MELRYNGREEIMDNLAMELDKEMESLHERSSGWQRTL